MVHFGGCDAPLRRVRESKNYFLTAALNEKAGSTEKRKTG
jgi:hypothetical protein